MKKFIKICALCLAVCATFVFSACGKNAVESQFNSTANVNTGNEASYQSCTKNDFVQYVNANTNDNTLEMSGYRMSGTIQTKVTDEETEELVDTTITLNMLVLNNNGSIEMAIKMNSDGMDIYSFVKDNYMYFKMVIEVYGEPAEIKVKSQLPNDFDYGDLDLSESIVNFEDLYEMINNTEDLKISTYIDGTTTRYKVEMDYKGDVGELVESGKYVSYYVFENNLLSEFSVTLTSDITTMNLNMCKYTGSIAYPNLNEYVDYSSFI